MSQSRFFTKRFYLDSPFSRSTGQASDHYVGSPIKAFAVTGTNNAGFNASIVLDASVGHVQGIALYDGFYQNFKTKPNSVYIENKIAQPGVWIDILFSLEDELNLGAIKQQSKSFTIPYEGTAFTMAKVTVTSVVAEIVPSNDQRSVAVLQHKSGDIIWIGSPTDLANADYQNICYKVSPGETFIWKNAASLSAKTAAGSSVFSLTQETL